VCSFSSVPIAACPNAEHRAKMAIWQTTRRELLHAGLLLGKADASSKIVIFSMKKVIPEELASCRASNSKRER